MDTHTLIRLRRICFLISIFLVSLARPGLTQDCGNDCQCILDLARQSAKAEVPDFQKALRLFNAAKICYPDSSEIIDAEVVEMFITINRLKIQADSASLQAKIAAQEAIIARDSASSATDRALRESQRATTALRQEKLALDSLVEVKNDFQEQYERATANENSVLISNALDNKEQFKAWNLGREKRQLIGDSLGISKDSLANSLKQNDRILVQTKQIDRKTLYTVSIGSQGHCLGLQSPGQHQSNLILYDLNNDQQSTLLPNAISIPSWERFDLLGQWDLNSPKITFSKDGSRIAVVQPRMATFYQIYQDSVSGLTTELLYEYKVLDVNSIFDRITGVSFTQDNEPFIYTALELVPVKRPEERIQFPGQLLVDVEIQKNRDSTYKITAEYLDFYPMLAQFQYDSTAYIDHHSLEWLFAGSPNGGELKTYFNYQYLVVTKNIHIPFYFNNSAAKSSFLKFTYPVLRGKQPVEWQFGKKYNTQISADQLLRHYSGQFLISKEGPFVSYQNEAGRVLASFSIMGKKIKVRAAPLDTLLHPEMPEILSYDSLNVWGWTSKGALAFKITEEDPILGIAFLDGSYFSSDEEGAGPSFRSYYLTYTSRYLKIWDDTGRLISAAETKSPIESAVVDRNKKKIYVLHENAGTSVWHILHPDKPTDMESLMADSMATSQ